MTKKQDYLRAKIRYTGCKKTPGNDFCFENTDRRLGTSVKTQLEI